MGIIRQLRRAMINAFSDFKNIFKRKKEKTPRRSRKREPIKINKSWKKNKKDKTSDFDIIQTEKRRIPGLKFFKRMIAAILLLINFIFSQFLLGSIGSQSQWVFLLFLGNSFIIGDYLWKTRGKKTG
jgi:hypothetical protein